MPGLSWGAELALALTPLISPYGEYRKAMRDQERSHCAIAAWVVLHSFLGTWQTALS